MKELNLIQIKAIIKIIVVIIVTSLVLRNCVCNNSENTSTYSDNSDYEGPIRSAYTISKIFVMEKLNYPEEADFPILPISKEDLGNNIYKVKGNVTAKNAFGVKETKTFTCVMEFSGNGETTDQTQWTVTALYFN